MSRTGIEEHRFRSAANAAFVTKTFNVVTGLAERNTEHNAYAL